MTRSDIEQSLKEVREVINCMWGLLCDTPKDSPKRELYEKSLFSSYAAENKLAKELDAICNA